MTKEITIPGLTDVHVHLREPGEEDKESFKTGTMAALAGGITTVLDMPNNPNPVVNQESFDVKDSLAKTRVVCDYGLYLGATADNFEIAPKLIKEVCGLKIYLDSTHGPLLVRSLASTMAHFENWPRSKPICVHAEDSSMPTALGLSVAFGKHLHFCHVSQASELSLIKAAKRQGFSVSCEVAPHHLVLNEDDIENLGPFGLIKPPLRTKKDQAALWEGINSGVIDMVATDHAPHTKEEKLGENPPFGVPGLETMLPLLLTAVAEGRMTMEKLIELTSENPAKIFRLDQERNESHVLIDVSQEWEIPSEGFQTRCDWSPFSGFQVRGKVREVWLRGEMVWNGERVLVNPGYGRRVNAKNA